jgi:hypothetical protein
MRATWSRRRSARSAAPGQRQRLAGRRRVARRTQERLRRHTRSPCSRHGEPRRSQSCTQRRSTETAQGDLDPVDCGADRWFPAGGDGDARRCLGRRAVLQVEWSAVPRPQVVPYSPPNFAVGTPCSMGLAQPLARHLRFRSPEIPTRSPEIPTRSPTTVGRRAKWHRRPQSRHVGSQCSARARPRSSTLRRRRLRSVRIVIRLRWRPAARWCETLTGMAGTGVATRVDKRQ